MKVLLANKFFFPNGGSETVLFQERSHLVASGVEVVDFSMQDVRNLPSSYSPHFVSNRQYRAGQGKLRSVGAAVSMVHSPEAVRRIGKLLDETKPDLMHCHNIYHQLTPSIIRAAKLRGVPVVLTLHDYKVVCPVHSRLRHGAPCSQCLEGNFFRVAANRCEQGSLAKSMLLYAEAAVQRALRSYEQVDRFIAPSLFMLQAVSHRFAKERISLLYNGIDTMHSRPSARDGNYVLYFGRLSSEKGAETLLQAQELARGTWALVIAGTGPLERMLRSRYPYATFVGHLSSESLKETIANASLVVVPSRWYENCSMSVLEAMAHGKAVVGTTMGGIPELVADGKTGCLFNAGRADQLAEIVGRLMNDDVLRASMGTAGRDRVQKNFSLDAHHVGLLEIYRSVCQ
ncbi:MAG TPA: glycosyltransferase family 4 protein [Rhizomicrobium sp.]|jgi:glycosyltransferase involved in cell wall biosynthesis|nr:glycosyltransferase family 4 protein [Rhizomicrobium sp.]